MISLACNFSSRCSATCTVCLLAAVRIAVVWQTTALQLLLIVAVHRLNVVPLPVLEHLLRSSFYEAKQCKCSHEQLTCFTGSVQSGFAAFAQYWLAEGGLLHSVCMLLRSMSHMYVSLHDCVCQESMLRMVTISD